MFFFNNSGGYDLFLLYFINRYFGSRYKLLDQYKYYNKYFNETEKVALLCSKFLVYLARIQVGY